MNKKVIIAIIAIAAIAIVAGYALIIPAFNTVLAQQTTTKQITLSITKGKYATYKEQFVNVTSGSWSFTLTNVSGEVKDITILMFNHDKPREGFFWSKLDPKVGDSVTVNLPAGTYTLRILIFGTLNSTVTVTVAYP